MNLKKLAKNFNKYDDDNDLSEGVITSYQDNGEWHNHAVTIKNIKKKNQKYHVEAVTSADWKKSAKLPKTFRIKKDAFQALYRNFYMTDPISRSSKTMAECTRCYIGQKPKQLEAA